MKVALKYPINLLKYPKSNIPYMSKDFYPKKVQKFWQQIEFAMKYRMSSYKFYPNPENFTSSRMVWMVTFSKSDARGYVYK